MTQKCNGDCFNCIYDDCIIDYRHATSVRLQDKHNREEKEKIKKKPPQKQKRKKLKGGFCAEYISTPLPKLWSEVEID